MLRKFVEKVNPGGPGWRQFKDVKNTKGWSVPSSVISMILGCIFVYSILIGTGQIIYGQFILGIIILVTGCITGRALMGRFND